MNPHSGRDNTFVWVEQIEELPLIAGLPTHHDPTPSLNESNDTETGRADNQEPFFDSIDSNWTFILSPRDFQNRKCWLRTGFSDSRADASARRPFGEILLHKLNGLKFLRAPLKSL